MTVRKIGRRWMLLGSAGAALSIPALPSLLTTNGFSNKALAAPPDGARRMVAFMTNHGGVWQPERYPDQSMASESFTHPLHQCHRGQLSSTLAGGRRSLSPALSAPADVFSEALVDKMNVIRGLDVPFYYGHSKHIMGNYGRITTAEDELVSTADQVTADQVMAYSSAFYPTAPRRRTLYLGHQGLSTTYRDPGAGAAGGVQALEEVSPRTIFDAIYVPGEPGAETRPPPIDAVHASYERLRSAASGPGSRISTADRQRLELYMDGLSSLRASCTSVVDCSDVDPITGLSGEPSNYSRESYRRLNDLVVAAFLCDSSRLAVIEVLDPFIDAGRDWHDVAHDADQRVGGSRARESADFVRGGTQNFFQTAFLDLVNKLDAVTEGDGTMLDSSLVWWAPEAGSATHHGDSIPVVSAGGVCGAMETGHYLDLRNRDGRGIAEGGAGNTNEGRRPGACFFQWTTTYLDAFGIPRAEWETDGRSAFSAMYSSVENSDFGDQWDRDAMDRSCADPLPLLRS